MDIYSLVAWAAQNKQKLKIAGIVLVVVGALVGVYFWHANYETTSAEAALNKLPVPSPEDAMRMNPAPYLEVANLYPDTAAAARGLLLAGSIQYSSEKYDQAQATFQRYLSSHHDSPMLTQALVGLAASLEMQGKTNDAVARYEEVLRHSSDQANVIQASLALGRLYAEQGRVEQALTSLGRVAQETAQNTTWNAEARLLGQEIISKHPELQEKMRQQQQGAASLVPETPAGK